MDWSAAATAAFSGSKIFRRGWGGQYLEYDPVNFVWWIQYFDPTSKVFGTRHVVQATEFTAAEFTATDWAVMVLTDSTPPLLVESSSVIRDFQSDGNFYIGPNARFVPIANGFKSQVKTSAGVWVDEDVKTET